MPATTMITVTPIRAATPLDEVVRTARACADIGAAVVSVQEADPGRLADTVAALRESTELVVQLAAGALDAGPDVATCPLGDPRAAELHTELRDRGIVAAYEVGAPDQLAALTRLLDAHGLPYGGQVHCVLVLSGPAPLPALADAVRALPAGATFTATGVGPAALPVLLGALSAGGHLRVGLADTPEYAPGEPARNDAQLVARAAGVARIAQRPPATAAEARTLLGIRVPVRS